MQYMSLLILKNIINKFHIPKTYIEFGAYDRITNENTFYFWKKKVLNLF